MEGLLRIPMGNWEHESMGFGDFGNPNLKLTGDSWAAGIGRCDLDLSAALTFQVGQTKLICPLYRLKHSA